MVELRVNRMKMLWDLSSKDGGADFYVPLKNKKRYKAHVSFDGRKFQVEDSSGKKEMTGGEIFTESPVGEAILKGILIYKGDDGFSLLELKYAIEDILEKDPSTKHMKVVAASDIEGNSFEPVMLHPTTGNYNGEERMFDSESEDINAVCIN